MDYRRVFRSVEADQKRAVRAWVGTHFPARGADADEEQDATEQTDFAPAHAVVVMLSQATACLGIACCLPAIVCDTCKFSKKQMDMTDVEALLQKFGHCLHLPPKKMKPMFQSRNDALFDLFSFAPASRGRRAQHELRFSGRMGV